jgi:hypothetical protein
MTGLVTFLILAMGFASIQGTPRKYKTRAEIAGPILEQAALAEEALLGVWPGTYDKSTRLVGAVAMKESGLMLDAVGAGGEIGIMQINPNGLAQRECLDLDWRGSPVDNVRCGVRILDRARSRCPGAPPEVWLGLYKGWKKCGSSKYAHRVLVILEKGNRSP